MGAGNSHMAEAVRRSFSSSVATMLFMRTALLALAGIVLAVGAAPLVPRATYNNRALSSSSCARLTMS